MQTKSFRSLKHGYHEARLTDIVIGPGPEAKFHIQLSPYINPTAPGDVVLHFSSIKNLEEVRLFSESIKKNSKPEIYDIKHTDKDHTLICLSAYPALTIFSAHCQEY
jgi:hypothetical protein